MKLNKLTSAVSVSLLAVALTACGSDDDAPIINTPTTTTPAPTTNTGTTTTTPADNSANIAALTAAFKAAGLSDDKAAELANANPTITAGGAEFTALVNAAKTPANTGTNTAVSEVVEKQNPFINGVDTNKFATVTANQYTRQPGSNFDKSANPADGLVGGLGAVGIDDPTTQNPYLSNYVLAVEVIGKDVVAIDSTGEQVVKGDKDAGKVIAATESPYVNKAKDGLRYTAQTLNQGAKTFNYAANAETAKVTETEHYNLLAANNTTITTDGTLESNAIVDSKKVGSGTDGARVDIKAGLATGKIYTIQDFNHSNVEINAGVAKGALDVATQNTAGLTAHGPNGKVTGAANGAKSGLVVYNSKSIVVGNADGAKLGYLTPSYGLEENIYDADGVVLNSVESHEAAKADGSVKANQNRTDAFLAKETVQYSAKNDKGKVFFIEKYKALGDAEAEASNAVVGSAATVLASGHDKAFSDPETKALAKNVANTFETRVFGKNYNSYDAGKTGTQKENTYVGRYNSKNQLSSVGVSTLSNVQYGRLTNNIDVLADKSTATKPIIYRQFQQHGADNTVDTYFYRGTNHTTVEQMEALKAKGGTIQYYGHALTYGVGPKVPTTVVTSTNTLPTAYGAAAADSVTTIGNFVQAKFDVAKGRVDGSVYNFLSEKEKPQNTDFVRQDLIKFGGDVYGNTVTGTATKEGTAEKGTFTGSFFGSAANELGGSISSITRGEGYTQPKWGAVFGATKGSSVENFNVIEQGNP